jgi:hypothetical protein
MLVEPSAEPDFVDHRSFFMQQGFATFFHLLPAAFPAIQKSVKKQKVGEMIHPSRSTIKCCFNAISKLEVKRKRQTQRLNRPTIAMSRRPRMSFRFEWAALNELNVQWALEVVPFDSLLLLLEAETSMPHILLSS